MARKIKPTYSGALAEPTKTTRIPSGENPREIPGLMHSSQKEIEDEASAYEAAMLLLLLDHFDIPRGSPERWRTLALDLAKRHVPGFQYPADGGRPRKWSSHRDAVAKICIDRFMAEHPTHSINSAAASVAKQSPWKDFLGNGKRPAEQIRQAYFRATPRALEFVLTIADSAESIPAGTRGIFALLVGDAVRCQLSEESPKG